MFVDYHALAFGGIALTIVAVFVTEFAPWRRISRVAARSAILLSVLSGSVWCYAIYLKGYVFSPYEAQHFARKSGGGATYFDRGGSGGGPVRVRGRSGGGDAIGPDGEAEDEVASGSGGIVTRGAARVSAGVDGIVESLIPSRKSSSTKYKPPADIDGDVKRDCMDCPEMVVIAGGTALIGAPENDINASAAERPQRQAKIWPGFAISRQPIQEAEYAAYQKETGVPSRVCSGLAPEPLRLVRCLRADEAERYAAWLSLRTGLQFKVPTAIEWEFAARHRGLTVVASIEAPKEVAPLLGGIGRDIAEMTSECYDPYIPSAGLERRADAARPWLCEERVLKGARPGEDAIYQRFSARRPWRHDAPDAGVGFRVVRALR